MTAKEKIERELKVAAISNFLTVVAPKIKPASPLKGANNNRRRISDLPFYRLIKHFIPPAHKETVCIYRGAGYSGPVDFTTPEVFNGVKLIASNF